MAFGNDRDEIAQFELGSRFADVILDTIVDRGIDGGSALIACVYVAAVVMSKGVRMTESEVMAEFIERLEVEAKYQHASAQSQAVADAGLMN